MAIYDTMQFVKSDVATVSMGLAASMGQVLLCAGAAGKRYALPHSRIMMHQASGGIGGTASDIRIQAEQAILLKRDMARLIAEHTGQTFEQIELDFERDRWFTAQQAKDYGFVDHVVAQRRPGRRRRRHGVNPATWFRGSLRSHLNRRRAWFRGSLRSHLNQRARPHRPTPEDRT